MNNYVIHLINQIIDTHIYFVIPEFCYPRICLTGIDIIKLNCYPI